VHRASLVESYYHWFSFWLTFFEIAFPEPVRHLNSHSAGFVNDAVAVEDKFVVVVESAD